MGTQDPDFPDPAKEAQWVADQVKGRVEMIEGAGHYPHTEFPEVTALWTYNAGVGLAPPLMSKKVTAKPSSR